MAKFNEETQRFDWGEPEACSFNWTPYENRWNGKSLKHNSKVELSKYSKDKVYCHESYAQNVYNAMSGVKVSGSKELIKNSLVSVTDINAIDGNSVMITINGGANNVVVDLNKEHQFFNQFTVNDEGDTMSKDMFVKALADPSFKENLLGMDLTAKITAGDNEKASIWDGYVESMKRDMIEQISKKSKAYWATILSTNKGGFVVDIMNTVKAFMPGSMAASNRITDFDSMIGTRFEVMVESWDPNYGFVVSRKKFLRTMLPSKLAEMEAVLKDNPDTVFTGHVTGTTPFGVFVELSDFITGMLHKTLVRDETREAMRENSIEAGTEIQVYVHKIEKNRVILSDVPSAERDAVIARREAEENQETPETAENA